MSYLSCECKFPESCTAARLGPGCGARCPSAPSYLPLVVVCCCNIAILLFDSVRGGAVALTATMTDPVVENLILDLLEWLAKQDRPYEETMDAWRTSCPKLPVWEDATDRGLVSMDIAQGRNIVRITEAGLALLEQHRLPRAR